MRENAQGPRQEAYPRRGNSQVTKKSTGGEIKRGKKGMEPGAERRTYETQSTRNTPWWRPADMHDSPNYRHIGRKGERPESRAGARVPCRDECLEKEARVPDVTAGQRDLEEE